MSMFTLAVSCLTTSNFLLFVDLAFQVPMQYRSLQHQSLFLSPITSTTGCYFCFSSISSFFLELFLNSCSIAYWVTTVLGRQAFSVLSLCVFILFMGFSKQEYSSGLPFPFLVDHIFRTLLHDMSVLGGLKWHGSEFHWVRQGCGPFDQFDKFSVTVVFILSTLSWRRIRDLLKLPGWRDWRLWGKLGFVQMGGTMLIKPLIQFSLERWSCVPSLLFDLRPNYGGGNADNGDLLQNVHAYYTLWPQPCCCCLSLKYVFSL